LQRTGTALLPLHGGCCPRWLFEKMQRLGIAILEVIVRESGPREVLRRLSDPLWFQSLGCVVGFDWHSSGLTTTLCGALKEGLRGRERDLGLVIAGGKGGVSRNTPQEIFQAVERLAWGVEVEELVFKSRMAAKIDNAALQDGYTLYHHVFVFTRDGLWAVIQQGLNEANRLARRYHWLGEKVKDMVCEPHAAICCPAKGEALNMVAEEASLSRQVVSSLARERPERIAGEFKKILEKGVHLALPWRHEIPRTEYLNKALLKLYEVQPQNFLQVLGVEGVGPKTIRALAMVAEVAYGAPASFRDPVRYSFAHGGKDGHPYPVDRNLYQHTLEMLEKALREAKMGRSEKLEAFRRLSALAGSRTW